MQLLCLLHSHAPELQRVYFCGEDEVVFGETSYRMGPQLDCDFPPREEYIRMMTFGFGQLPYFVGKRKREYADSVQMMPLQKEACHHCGDMLPRALERLT